MLKSTKTVIYHECSYWHLKIYHDMETLYVESEIA